MVFSSQFLITSHIDNKTQISTDTIMGASIIISNSLVSRVFEIRF